MVAGTPFRVRRWTQSAAEDRTLLATLTAPAASDPARTPPTAFPRAEMARLDQALATMVRELMAGWTVLAPHVRLYPTPVAITPDRCTDDRVVVPLVLWVQRSSIIPAQEQRVQYRLARLWKRAAHWRSEVRTACRYHPPTTPPPWFPDFPAIGSHPRLPWETAAARWDDRQAAWSIRIGSAMRFLWAVWTPVAGWRLEPFIVHGCRVPQPTRRDVQRLARQLLATDPPATAATRVYPAYEDDPPVVWTGVFFLSFLGLFFPGILRWLVLAPWLGAFGLIVIPRVRDHRGYRHWREWLRIHTG